jgi:hypothetical protein
MKMLAFVLLFAVMAAVPLATAQEEHVLKLNMSLGEMEPVDPCVLSGQCAIGHVYVNVTEPPPEPAGITGFFAFQPMDIDLGSIFSTVKGFFSGLFCKC